MKNSILDYKTARKERKSFIKRYYKPSYRYLKKEEDWINYFTSYDKYELKQLEIEDMVEFEYEIDVYIQQFIKEIVNHYDYFLQLERDLESYKVDLLSGDDELIYPPYPLGDYVLFKFSSLDYLYVPPENKYVYVFGEEIKRVFGILEEINDYVIKCNSSDCR